MAELTKTFAVVLFSNQIDDFDGFDSVDDADGVDAGNL